MQQTILIVNDDEDEILLTTMALAKIGGTIAVEAAQSGEAGLAYLRGGAPLPALVLLDLKMPGMDGIDVLRAIRADERSSRLPVIIVTHTDSEAGSEPSYQNGANSFLNKTADLKQFTDHLRKELERWLGQPG